MATKIFSSFVRTLRKAIKSGVAAVSIRHIVKDASKVVTEPFKVLKLFRRGEFKALDEVLGSKRSYEFLQREYKATAYFHVNEVKKISAALADDIPNINRVSNAEAIRLLKQTPKYRSILKYGGTVATAVGTFTIIGLGLDALVTIKRNGRGCFLVDPSGKGIKIQSRSCCDGNTTTEALPFPIPYNRYMKVCGHIESDNRLSLSDFDRLLKDPYVIDDVDKMFDCGNNGKCGGIDTCCIGCNMQEIDVEGKGYVPSLGGGSNDDIVDENDDQYEGYTLECRTQVSTTDALALLLKATGESVIHTGVGLLEYGVRELGGGSSSSRMMIIPFGIIACLLLFLFILLKKLR
jgi:hypothetical protein